MAIICRIASGRAKPHEMERLEPSTDPGEDIEHALIELAEADVNVDRVMLAVDEFGMGGEHRLTPQLTHLLTALPAPIAHDVVLRMRGELQASARTLATLMKTEIASVETFLLKKARTTTKRGPEIVCDAFDRHDELVAFLDAGAECGTSAAHLEPVAGAVIMQLQVASISSERSAIGSMLTPAALGAVQEF